MANGYCGPFALSYALGVSIAAASALLRDVTGRRAIKCVHVDTMDEILTGVIAERWKWKSPRVHHAPCEWRRTPNGMTCVTLSRDKEERPTFLAFGSEQIARHERACAQHGLYLVATVDHYMILDGPRVLDNCGTGLLGEHYASKRRLTEAWRLARPGSGSVTRF